MKGGEAEIITTYIFVDYVADRRKSITSVERTRFPAFSNARRWEPELGMERVEAGSNIQNLYE
jgi:hypothetical protein